MNLDVRQNDNRSIKIGSAKLEEGLTSENIPFISLEIYINSSPGICRLKMFFGHQFPMPTYMFCANALNINNDVKGFASLFPFRGLLNITFNDSGSFTYYLGEKILPVFLQTFKILEAFGQMPEYLNQKEFYSETLMRILKCKNVSQKLKLDIIKFLFSNS